MRLAIVGAGRASLAFLDQLGQLDGYDIVAICDIQADAPGMLRARELGIATLTDLAELFRTLTFETVVELTGNEMVANKVREHMKDSHTLVESGAARMSYDLLMAQENQRVERDRGLAEDFDDILREITGAIAPIDQTQVQLDKLLNKIRIVNINAKVEAARLGDQGRAFDVIVNEVHGMIGQIATSLESIQNASSQARTLLERISDKKNALLA